MKQKISVAARPSTPKNLSRNHYTTLNFGHIYPIYVEEMPYNSKVNIRANNFSRVAPQFLPNLGRLDMKLHAFYVPFKLVWNHFDNFYQGLPSWNNQGSQVFKYVPTFNDNDLTFFFANVDEYELAEECTVDDGWDFMYQQTMAVGIRFFKFTPFGKYVYHIFNSLGYNFTFVSSAFAPSFSEPMSALPLLSFFKVYLDYFIPSQLQPSSSLHSLFAWLHDLPASTMYDWYNNIQSGDTQKQNFMNRIFQFLQEMYYYYQNNYFTSAWMSPNAVVPGLNNIGNEAYDRPVINSTTSQSSTASNSLRTQNLQNGDGYVKRVEYPMATVGSVTNIPNTQSTLTADGITFMQKFARFVKRSNFVGSRVLERILGQFGIRITDFESSLSTYLGSTNFVMQQSDVTVTGSSQEAGDYTGKGWFNSDTDRVFKANCDLYGMVFVTASIQTPSTFVDGIRKRNKHIQPLDYYNPDLDGSIMQAISGSELFKRNTYVGTEVPNSLDELGLSPSQTFGYQLRYMEMKTSIDDISGDFCVPSLNKNIDNFILPRRIFDPFAIRDFIIMGNDDYNPADFAYSPTLKGNDAMTPVVSLKGDDMYQFNRIFRMTDGQADPIFGVFRFDVVVNNAVIPADTSSELDGKGKELEFESNGVHV